MLYTDDLIKQREDQEARSMGFRKEWETSLDERATIEELNKNDLEGDYATGLRKTIENIRGAGQELSFDQKRELNKAERKLAALNRMTEKRTALALSKGLDPKKFDPSVGAVVDPEKKGLFKDYIEEAVPGQGIRPGIKMGRFLDLNPNTTINRNVASFMSGVPGLGILAGHAVQEQGQLEEQGLYSKIATSVSGLGGMLAGGGPLFQAGKTAFRGATGLLGRTAAGKAIGRTAAGKAIGKAASGRVGHAAYRAAEEAAAFLAYNVSVDPKHTFTAEGMQHTLVEGAIFGVIGMQNLVRSAMLGTYGLVSTQARHISETGNNFMDPHSWAPTEDAIIHGATLSVMGVTSSRALNKNVARRIRMARPNLSAKEARKMAAEYLRHPPNQQKLLDDHAKVQNEVLRIASMLGSPEGQAKLKKNNIPVDDAKALSRHLSKEFGFSKAEIEKMQGVLREEAAVEAEIARKQEGVNQLSALVRDQRKRITDTSREVTPEESALYDNRKADLAEMRQSLEVDIHRREHNQKFNRLREEYTGVVDHINKLNEELRSLDKDSETYKADSELIKGKIDVAKKQADTKLNEAERALEARDSDPVGPSRAEALSVSKARMSDLQRELSIEEGKPVDRVSPDRVESIKRSIEQVGKQIKAIEETLDRRSGDRRKKDKGPKGDEKRVEGPDRRRRGEIDDGTYVPPDKKSREDLLEDTMIDKSVGVSTGEAWRSFRERPIEGIADMNNMSHLNLIFGYKQADVVIKGYFESFKEAGFGPQDIARKYRGGGDEALIAGDLEYDFLSKLEKAQEIFRNKEFELEAPDGTKVKVKGFTFSWGYGAPRTSVKGKLDAMKQSQLEQGLRVADKTEIPKFLRDALEKSGIDFKQAMKEIEAADKAEAEVRKPEPKQEVLDDAIAEVATPKMVDKDNPITPEKLKESVGELLGGKGEHFQAAEMVADVYSAVARAFDIPFAEFIRKTIHSIMPRVDEPLPGSLNSIKKSDVVFARKEGILSEQSSKALDSLQTWVNSDKEATRLLMDLGFGATQNAAVIQRILSSGVRVEEIGRPIPKAEARINRRKAIDIRGESRDIKLLREELRNEKNKEKRREYRELISAAKERRAKLIEQNKKDMRDAIKAESTKEKPRYWVNPKSSAKKHAEVQKAIDKRISEFRDMIRKAEMESGYEMFDADWNFKKAHKMEVAVTPEGDALYPGFTTSFEQRMWEDLDTFAGGGTKERLRQDMVKSVEANYNKPGSKAKFYRTLNAVTNRNFSKLMTALSKSQKTYAALNLSTQCPMFDIGNMGCYSNRCYGIAAARGGRNTPMFNEAPYFGELLMVKDIEIDAMNAAGGLRLNGMGDTTARTANQWRDIIKHAGMRGLNTKVITKQKTTFDLLSDLTRPDSPVYAGMKKEDIDMTVESARKMLVQPTVDSYWMPVDRGLMLDGSALSPKGELGKKYEAAKKKFARTKDSKALEAVAKEYEEMTGRATRIMDGQLWNKNGFSSEQLKAMVNDPKNEYLNVLPRAVVMTAKEIVEYARVAPEILQTWMHTPVRTPMFSDVHGKYITGEDMLDFGRGNTVVDVLNQEIYSVNKQGERIRSKSREAVDQYIKDNITDPKEREQIYRTLRKQTCCQAALDKGAKKDMRDRLKKQGVKDVTGECMDCSAACGMGRGVSHENMAKMFGRIERTSIDGAYNGQLFSTEFGPEGDLMKKAAVKFLEDSRAVIQGLSAPTVRDVFHEMGHIIRRFLPDAELRIAEEVFGVKDGAWDVEAGVLKGKKENLPLTKEELFADAFVEYLETGGGQYAPARMKKVFDRIREVIAKLYDKLTGANTFIEKYGDSLTPEMLNFFDMIMNSTKAKKHFDIKGGREKIAKEREAARNQEATRRSIDAEAFGISKEDAKKIGMPDKYPETPKRIKDRTWKNLNEAGKIFVERYFKWLTEGQKGMEPENPFADKIQLEIQKDMALAEFRRQENAAKEKEAKRIADEKREAVKDNPRKLVIAWSESVGKKTVKDMEALLKDVDPDATVRVEMVNDTRMLKIDSRIPEEGIKSILGRDDRPTHDEIKKTRKTIQVSDTDGNVVQVEVGGKKYVYHKADRGGGLGQVYTFRRFRSKDWQWTLSDNLEGLYNDILDFQYGKKTKLSITEAKEIGDDVLQMPGDSYLKSTGGERSVNDSVYYEEIKRTVNEDGESVPDIPPKEVRMRELAQYHDVKIDPLAGIPLPRDAIVLDLARALGKKLRTNTGGTKGYLPRGTYRPAQGIASTRYYGDLQTTAHEAGHMIDDQYSITDYGSHRLARTFDREITHDYATWVTRAPGSIRLQRQESFAEWLRSWLANPREAEAVAPEFSKYFKETVDPTLMKALKQYSNEIRIREGASALALGAALLTRPSAMAFKLKSLWGGVPDSSGFRVPWLYKWAGNRWKPLLYAMERLYRDQADYGMSDPLPAEDARIMARLFAGRDDMLMRMYDEGIFDPTKHRDPKNKQDWIVRDGIEKLFEGLDQSSPDAFNKDYHNAVMLGIAERIIELKQRPEFKDRDPVNVTDTPGGDLKWAHEAIRQLNAENTPEKMAVYKNVVTGIRRWGNGLLKYAEKRGRISKETLDDVLQNNEAWVPLMRIVDLETDQLGTWNAHKTTVAPTEFGAAKKPIFRIKGSRRGVKDMFQSLLEATNRIVVESERNYIARLFVDAATVNRGMHDKRVGGERRLPIAGDVIAKMMPEDATSPMEIAVWRDGKKERWKFMDKDVYDAFQGLSKMGIQVNGAMKGLIQWPAKLLRHAIVHSPPFIVRNYVRDTIRRSIISDKAGTLLPFETKDITSPEGKIATYELYGGGQGKQYLYTHKNWEKEASRRLKQLAGEPNTVVSSMAQIRKLGSWYHKGAMMSEIAGRIPEYREQLKHAKEVLGYDDMNAALYATFKARDLLDFAIAGEYSQFLTMLNPFTNAGIQGLKRDMVALLERPTAAAKIGFITKWMSMVVIPEIAAHHLAVKVDREDEYLQMPNWRKLLFWNYPIPSESGTRWLSVPKPFELGALGTGVYQAWMAATGKDPDALRGLPKAMLNTIVPVDLDSFMPLLVKINSNIKADYDSFYESTIVGPEGKASAERRTQEDARGSTIAKIIQAPLMAASRGLHSMKVFLKTAESDEPFYIDQREIDYVLRSVTGTLGSMAIDLSNEITGRNKGKEYMLGLTGMVREGPGPQARDVKWVRERYKRLGKRLPTRLDGLIKDYYQAESVKDRDEIGRKIVSEAKKLRARIDPFRKKRGD